MNRVDDQLDRLLRAAQRAHVEHVAPPFGAETRILAAWGQRASALSTIWDAGLLRRGLVLAGVITLASFLPALSAAVHTTPFADVTQLTDSTLAASDTP